MGQRKSRLAPPIAQPPPFIRVTKPPEPNVIATVKPSDTLSLRIQTASLHELLEIRRVAAKHSTAIRTIHISMGSRPRMPYQYSPAPEAWIELDGSLQHVDYRPIDWDALLALLPGVRRLDLSNMPLTSLHARKIVEAASRCCAELEALVLPTKVTKRGVNDEVEPLLRVLSEAMKKWGAREERRGLTELTAPCYARSFYACSSGELLQLVVAECPRLTALDIALWHTNGNQDAKSWGDTVDGSFCVMLPRSCPRLSRFTLRDILPACRTTTTRTLTDGELLALGRLAFLTDLQLRPANFTGHRLFEFLDGFPSDHCGSRLLQISIGDPKSTERVLEAFRVLMERLEATSRSDLRLTASDFLLRVNNGNVTDVETALVHEYLGTVEPLVARVKAKHPSLRIRLTTQGTWGATHDKVFHFWLYTRSLTRKPPQDWDWGFDRDMDNSFPTLGGKSRSYSGNGGIGGGCG